MPALRRLTPAKYFYKNRRTKKLQLTTITRTSKSGSNEAETGHGYITFLLLTPLQKGRITQGLGSNNDLLCEVKSGCPLKGQHHQLSCKTTLDDH